ncbi:MAG: hypothetical protein JAZ20_08490 [Candidatus Thiodiazotropha weberae]|nr:hypothetical protein [Candidatus Thiodiazotropha lotti]MCW4207604.1 hypothetical protein [Candidatus Thiodiazotropha lotti]
MIRYLLLIGLAGLATTLCMADESGDTPTDSRKYYVEDIKSTMMQHIEDVVDENGVFRLRDDKTGEVLTLKFVRIHDPVRQIGSDIYFACTDFHVVGEPDKLYDLDFWMNDNTGQLKIYQSKVHKEPRWSLLYGWYKQPRYTFVNDEIEYLY